MRARARLYLPLALLAPARERRNVLLITVDDLNTDLGCYGHPIVQTPNIDALARRGVRFGHAYCQYPVCNPSRTSFLSGLYPERTGVLDNRTNPRERLKGLKFLPQYFRAQGYFTASIGKIYHDGMHAPQDWDVYLDPRGTAKVREGEGRNLTGGKFAFFHWVASEAGDEEHPDGQIAAEAIRLLEEKRDTPFFLAVGFRKPHDPYIAPKRYFDLYPPDRIPPTPGPADDEADIPKTALPPVRHNLGPQEGREFRRAYWSCISFMDAQAGKVLNALDRLRLAENTLVVFLGDNGLHLGEHGWWNKVTLFERSARIPLIAAGAPARSPGQACRRVVELVDLYPTFLDYCGFPAPHQLAGKSLLPLLANPEAPWDKAAYSVVTRADGQLGRSIRTERFRYTEWPGGGAELYDHDTDPNEYHNLAGAAAYAAAADRLRARLAAFR